MYITLNEEKINYGFSPFVNLKVSGPDHFYYVELREYSDQDDQSKHIDGYKITTS